MSLLFVNRMGLPLAAVVALCACPSIDLPEGVDCARTTEAGPDLAKALQGARAGDCVVPAAGTYRGSFTVPAGVALVGAVGTEVRIQGEQANAPALTLVGGVGSALANLSVVDAPGNGVRVDGSPASVIGLTVVRAAATGLLVACRDGDQACRSRPVRVTGARLTANSIGLWAYRASVRVEGGRIADQSSSSLGGGYGVVASHGAALEMEATLVQNNQEVGVLVDGGATRVTLTDLEVRDNRGRGIWAQGLEGSEADPALRVQGEKTLVDNNRIVGIGMSNARGIIIINGRISNTREAPVAVDLGGTGWVGDGIGVFASSGEITVDSVEITANQRAQLLVDHGASGIIIINGRISLGGGRYLVVVQGMSLEYDGAPRGISEPGTDLSVSSGSLGLSTP